MDLDPVILARMQFAFTIVFHIVFPAFTIGLSAWIATLIGLTLWTKNPHYENLAAFWTKIFAVSFAMGVVSGIVLTYQFGTNWSVFSRMVGNVIGPLIGYEVLTAFFLEASFLGILLFGRGRVPPGLHFFAAVLVAVGTAISAFWILSANSWMQAPAGFEMRDGVAYPTDWLAIIFNPTFPLRLAHMLIAAYVTTGFVVLAIGARYWLQGKHVREAETMVKMALGILVVLTPLQILVGDFHGLKALEYQPAKVAGLEGHWDGAEPAPLVLFALPDASAEANRFELAIPHLGSLILTHDWNGLYDGLKSFAPEDRPPVLPIFLSFRIMVGIGFLMAGIALWGVLAWARGRLFETGWFMSFLTYVWPLGFLAVIAGWVTTEMGRQPWVVTGLLRTEDAISPVTASEMLTSLILFVLVYAVVFASGLYFINRLLLKGPMRPIREHGLANRPITGASETGRIAIASGE
ncbi:cytochrome ubiquinol oxidase subunit I [Methylobrevis pamukkalensis]|uniref:Cytochrome bd-I ubiquinol oxidase subunit 1 n=1 Tax=Methylobrevis pamukkalensis TaxID=1439726 RepID=A0A1E3GZE2_9HYPH|nr:cytochrome ubiquinol oxidase subunit I [Methylobrevis pamukkalensis]ODN69437.1 Cytochrome bd-I ubiquinol oxidase subunit 1 [Methylobrevis pamukkalensis]